MKYEDAAWWLASELGREPHEWLLGLVTTMREKQGIRYTNFRRLINIFEWGYKAAAFTAETGIRSTPAGDVPLEEHVLAFNHAQNIVETVHAKVCKSRIIPMPLTTGAGYLQRQTAKDLGKALEGEFDDNDVDGLKQDVVLDGLIGGLGAAKVLRRWGRVVIEHVPFEDLLVDDAEGRYRKPRSIYQRQFVDRYVMLEEYAKTDPALHGTAGVRRERIINAANIDQKNTFSTGHDLLEVVEAWHLPSGPDAEDGRHVICIDACTLLDEPWTRDRFPFALYVPRPRRRQFWGLSIMYNLASGQREHERVTFKIQRANHRMGGTHIIASRQANVNPREIDNDQGSFFEYDGPNAPTVFNPDPVNPQTYEYRKALVDDMRASIGVSELSTQAQVPAGLQYASGKALQVYEDFESERLLVYHRSLERWILDLADLVIDEARLLVDEDKGYSSRYRAKRALETVKWKDVLLDRDAYVLKTFPVSMLAKTPAAKFAQLTELLNAGAIDVQQFRRLFEMPDLDAENDVDQADTDIIDRNLDLIVLKGKYLSPEPFDNLQLGLQRAGKFYNLCRANDVPEDRLELLRNWIEDARALMQPPPQPAAAAPAAPPPAMNGAPPMPPAPPPAPGPPAIPAAA